MGIAELSKLSAHNLRNLNLSNNIIMQEGVVWETSGVNIFPAPNGPTLTVCNYVTLRSDRKQLYIGCWMQGTFKMRMELIKRAQSLYLFMLTKMETKSKAKAAAISLKHTGTNLKK
jgi:hypothetical protein